MARPKKGEEKGKDAAVIQVNVEDFVKTRDSVVTGLTTLQAAVQDLSRAYIAHTNTVLGRAPGTSMNLITASTAFANPLGEQLLLAPRGATPGAKSEAGEDKKRKKRAHDPNAPKRPLTPYFLYMQSARQIIASDLGEGAKPGQISEEGTRRWKAMDEEEKKLWKSAYEENLIPYRKKTAAYKATLGNTDDAAAQLAAENGAATDAEIDEEDTENIPPPAPKAPAAAATPKSAKRRKTKDAADKDAKQTPVVPPAKETVIAPPSKEKDAKTPDKKRKRQSKGKKGEEEAAEAEKAKEAAAEAAPEKGKRANKRKRKSEAAADE